MGLVISLYFFAPICTHSTNNHLFLKKFGYIIFYYYICGLINSNMSEEERLLEELEKARDENSEAFQNCPPNLSYPDFHDYMAVTGKKLTEASRKYRMIKTPTYSDIPKYGDVMSLQDFLDNVECGGFIDYDGSGNYVKDGKESDIEIHPSDVKHGAIRKDFDTIVWYNK